MAKSPTAPTTDRRAALEPTGEVKRVRVLIIEDHALVGETMVLTLQSNGFDARLHPPSSPFNVKSALRWRPEFVVLDLDLGSNGDGTRFIRALREGGARVIVTTGTTDVLALARCYDAGASAVIEKRRPVSVLLSTIDDLLAQLEPSGSARQEILSARHRHLAQQNERLAPFKLLTPGEGRVLQYLMAGLSPQAISETSRVSIWTVRAQIKAILAKLGVTSQIAAVAFAYRAGWEG